MSATTTSTKNRRGRRRALLATGVLLGVTALATSAFFTDYGRLNMFGSGGGFGGEDNAYNLMFASENQTDSANIPAGKWLEATPEVDMAKIDGADALSPGGKGIYVNLPVKNASPKLGSTLKVKFANVTGVSKDETGAVTKTEVSDKDKAYAKLLRIDLYQAANASDTTNLGVAVKKGVTLDAADSVNLANLNAGGTTVVVAYVYLDGEASQEDQNAANGGHVVVQAQFNGQSTN